MGEAIEFKGSLQNWDKGEASGTAPVGQTLVFSFRRKKKSSF